jgi:nitrite reductase/ring-hydroxylating ferredoxin subunit
VAIGQNEWRGVGLDGQVQPASSNPVIVDGEMLAMWRGEDGPVRIWEDRCPHRGMRLSFGFVRGDALRCIYHGWSYRTDGQCIEIPAHPELTPPKTICASSYPAESRYGIVWTNLERGGPAPFPDLGPDEGWLPVRSLYVNRPAGQVEAAVESFDFGAPSSIRLKNPSAILLGIGSQMEMLLAIQPVNADRTGLHAVVRGKNASAARADLARRMQQLRAEIEAEREKT